MNLADIGEFGLIHRFAPQFLRDVQDNILGIGDDCAVIPHGQSESLLITTDLLLEDIHFLRSKIRPRELGRKSLAVNLSDIAAMGGTPLAAFLSLAIPKDTLVEWLDAFFAGLHSLSDETATPLLGGDTTQSKCGIVINIAVLGKAHPQQIKYRSTARVGDVICVTDVLGDSGGGLNILLQNLEHETDPDMQYLVQTHHNPTPQLAEGQWLAEQPSVNAMLDVSDGIDSDIQRIMEESKVGARIDIESIPISSSLNATSTRFGWNAKEIAATGGEDYCLLCTIDPKKYDEMANKFEKKFNKPLFRIGVIQPGELLHYYQDNQSVDFAKHGWNHFK
ncbi:thiamine-phosphate kinase [candidate division KSB1 bacterium]|nr:thiamine-phosphate kinase [candidate division KSB1 bacterium]RQW05615.1 MAG: thiamine-phosphate kinase [candidate division KSB1 bacterium]